VRVTFYTGFPDADPQQTQKALPIAQMLARQLFDADHWNSDL
jgi:hypothetical protein